MNPFRSWWLIPLGAFLAFAQNDASRTLVISNVALIDGTGKTMQPSMTVVVDHRTIVAIGVAAKTPIPKNSVVVSGRGKYLIPGLWDSHVHTLWDSDRPKAFFPLFLANGVTSVREMGGPMPAAEQVRWRQRVASGEVVGPDLVIPGPFVDGPKPVWQGSIKVADPKQAREAVDELAAAGVDFLKVYSQVPREAYFALAEQARKRRLPFAGHVPLLVDVAEASDAGQLSVEHLMGILLATSSAGSELKGRLLSGTNINELNAALVETFDALRATALFQRFVRNSTWQVPTLTIRHARPYLTDLAAAGDYRLQYLPKAITSGWSPRDDPRQPGTAAAIASRKKLYAKELELVGSMNRAGVRIVAGTDTPNPFCFPGFGIHDELALLVEAGLSTMEALQTATYNAALMNGREKVSGTIEIGKEANLVLLEANPLTDIHNSRKIGSVVLHGKLYAKSDLDRMLEQVTGQVQ